MSGAVKVDKDATLHMIENLYRTISIMKNSAIGIYPDPFIRDLEYAMQELEDAYQILELYKKNAMRKADNNS